MLKKQAKLDTSEIIKLKNKGKRVNTTLFSITFSPADTSKFAVTLSKKVYKLAVDRNRARRKVFSAIETLPLNKPGFYSISVKKPINTIKNEEIAKDLREVLCQK